LNSASNLLSISKKLEHCSLIYEQGFKFFEMSSRFGTLFKNQGTVFIVCYHTGLNLSHFMMSKVWNFVNKTKQFESGNFLLNSTDIFHKILLKFLLDSTQILIAKFQIWLDLEMAQIRHQRVSDLEHCSLILEQCLKSAIYFQKFEALFIY
jgi:hypothetical protein